MCQIASFKIICTDSTEILISRLRSTGLNYHLPKLSLLCRGGGGGGGGGSGFNKHYLLTFFF